MLSLGRYLDRVRAAYEMAVAVFPEFPILRVKPTPYGITFFRTSSW
jgi:hypothetical protein